MFILEFETVPPPNLPPYVILVVRESPYCIGRLESNDIPLNKDAFDVSRQHTKLEVLRWSEALVDGSSVEDANTSQRSPQQLFGAADEDRTVKSIGPNTVSPPNILPRHMFLEDDPLVLRVTNVSKFGTGIIPPMPPSLLSGGTSTNEGTTSPLVQWITSNTRVTASSHIVHDGWRIVVGASCVLRVSFRQVVVSIARSYAPEYITELEDVYRLLGATCTGSEGPLPFSLSSSHSTEKDSCAPTHSVNLGGHLHPEKAVSLFRQLTARHKFQIKPTPQPVAPILAAHVTETISDDSWSLMALASGYTVVLPSYVLEFFGAVAINCRAPVHELPRPSLFEPPKRVETFGTAVYVRPEPVTCPFSLYLPPAIAAGVLPRGAPEANNLSRHRLFGNKLFFAPTQLTQLRNGGAVTAAGGTIAHSMHDVLVWSKPGGPYAIASKYCIIEEAVAEAVEATTAIQLKRFCEQRRREGDEEMDHLCSSKSFSFGVGIDDDEDVNEPPTDAQEVAQSAPFDVETMRTMVKLFLLSRKLGWSMITERSLHISLLTNTFSPVFIAFLELAVHEMADDGDPAAAALPPPRAAKFSATHNQSAMLSSIASPPPKPVGRGDDADDADRWSDRTPSDIDSWHGDDDDEGGHRGTASSINPPPITKRPPDAQHVVVNRAAPLDHHVSPQLSIFESQVEFVSQTIYRLLNPTERLRIQTIAENLHQKRCIGPADRQYTTRMMDIAAVQLRKLEDLNVAPEISKGSSTRSSALRSLWQHCTDFYEMCNEILQGTVSHQRQARLNAADASATSYLPPVQQPVVLDDGSVPDAASALEDATKSDVENEASVNLSPHRLLRAARRERAELEGIAAEQLLRRGSLIQRFPPPVASFLGTANSAILRDGEGRKMLSLAEEHQITAKLIAHVPPTNVAAVAEKRRLFVHRYGPEEGEKRFQLWWQSNGPQWTVDLYKTLDSKNLSVLEMLEYE